MGILWISTPPALRIAWIQARHRRGANGANVPSHLIMSPLKGQATGGVCNVKHTNVVKTMPETTHDWEWFLPTIYVDDWGTVYCLNMF